MSSTEAYVVDEPADRSVQVRFTTVGFRPNQVLIVGRDDKLIKIAQDHGVQLRKR